MRKEGNDWVKKSMEMTVEGSRGKGRPKMTWEKVIKRDMKARGLSKRLTSTTVGKMASKCLLLLLLLLYYEVRDFEKVRKFL